MAQSISKMANVPVTIHFRDREIKLTALTPGDLGEIERWVKSQPMKAFKARILEVGDILLPEERATLFERALEETEARSSLSSEAAQKAQHSFEGIAFCLYLLVRHCDPTVTYEQALEILAFDREGVEDAMNEVLGLTDKDDDDEDEELGKQEASKI